MLHNEQTENMALLFAYGELGAEHEKDFTRHLKDCPRCQSLVRACAVATAALPDIKAPRFDFAPAMQPARPGLWDYISPLFNYRRLAPAAAMAVLLAFMGFAAYQYGAMPANTDLFADDMYAEITDIESNLDLMFEDFADL